MLLSFLREYIETKFFPSALGAATGFGTIIFLLMWLFNKFLAPKIKVKSKVTIQIWLVVRIIIAVLMVLWVFLFVAGMSGWF